MKNNYYPLVNSCTYSFLPRDFSRGFLFIIKKDHMQLHVIQSSLLFTKTFIFQQILLSRSHIILY